MVKSSHEERSMEKGEPHEAEVEKVPHLGMNCLQPEFDQN